MSKWSFTTTVGVWDEHPLLDCLYEYAEVECRVYVECDLYSGFEGSFTEPPEDPRAVFKSAEVTDIDFLPHDKDEGDLKVRVLVTHEMRKEIEKIALKKVVDEWSEDEVFRRYEDYYSDGPNRD